MWIKTLLALMITLPAWGYNLTTDFRNGFYWATLPINITVIDSNAVRKAKIEYLSRQAIQEWETATRLNLWEANNPATSNVIRWSDNFAAETNMDASTVLAVAVRYTGGPYFAKTEIIINGSHTYNHNNNYLLTTLTHELGHTMGLDHSGNFNAIMAPTLQMNFRGIDQDDERGMLDAYQQTYERQVTGYVSPLAYQTQKSSSPLSCGTVAVASSTSTSSGLISLASGILIGFVRKIFKWLKSLL